MDKYCSVSRLPHHGRHGDWPYNERNRLRIDRNIIKRGGGDVLLIKEIRQSHSCSCTPTMVEITKGRPISIL